MRILFISVLALVLPAALYAAGSGELRSGNKAYDNGKYGEAFEKYQSAEKAGEGKGVYNSGAALYRLKDYPAAAKAYLKAVEADTDLKQSAHFNAGDSYFMQEDKKKAAEQFKQAILLNPQDEAAIHNLQLSLSDNDDAKKDEGDGSRGENQDKSPGRNGVGESPQQQSQDGNQSGGQQNNSNKPKEQDGGDKDDGKDKNKKDKGQGKDNQGEEGEDKISKEEADSILQMLKEQGNQSQPITPISSTGSSSAPQTPVDKDW